MSEIDIERVPVRGVAALRATDPDRVAALLDAQSVQQCRFVTHRPPQTYCELTCGRHREYHSPKYNSHEFDGALTCESCKHIGGRYWGSDDHPIHFCGKSDERRAANFVDQGNFADNFMREWRSFYDAGPNHWAEKCAFFEPRTLPSDSGVAQPSEPKGPSL